MKIRSYFGWISAGLVATASAMGQVASGPGDSSGNFMADMDVSMKVMDRDMSNAPMTGDTDHDFAAMMIPHHQGAIDMAKGELKYGKDPVMRRLAEEIIVDQKSEIDVMNLWLAKQAAKKANQ
jgi:uncharacterized protein (DUF305 family)